MSVLDDLRNCAQSWDPEARLLGNVRACEIVELCDELERARAALEDKAHMLQLYAEQKDALAEALTAKNLAYTERNRLVAFLARLVPSGMRKTDIPGWDPEWNGCVFLDTSEGQLSWHYHDSDAHLFASLPHYSKPWDGHSTPEKYERLWRLTERVEADDERYREVCP